MHNIDICTQLILVDQCKPLTFEHRPRLVKVTCPKFLSGRVPRNEFTILRSLSDLLTIMTSGSLFDQGHTPFLIAPFFNALRRFLITLTTRLPMKHETNSVIVFFEQRGKYLLKQWKKKKTNWIRNLTYSETHQNTNNSNDKYINGNHTCAKVNFCLKQTHFGECLV